MGWSRSPSIHVHERRHKISSWHSTRTDTANQICQLRNVDHHPLRIRKTSRRVDSCQPCRRRSRACPAHALVDWTISGTRAVALPEREWRNRHRHHPLPAGMWECGTQRVMGSGRGDCHPCMRIPAIRRALIVLHTSTLGRSISRLGQKLGRAVMRSVMLVACGREDLDGACCLVILLLLL
jgi:hypothetical protein